MIDSTGFNIIHAQRGATSIKYTQYIDTDAWCGPPRHLP